MSQISDDTSKGGCCFPALFTDKATRANVKRAFYRISQLEKKINQIIIQQEKLRCNKSSSQIVKKKRKCREEEKRSQGTTGSYLSVHGAESVYVKRQEDAPSLITLPCGCVLEKRTLHSTSQVECNDKNVPRSLSTCGCGLEECKAAPSVSEQKCRLDCVDENSNINCPVGKKRTCHTHKGIVNIVPEEPTSSDYVPLKTIHSCLDCCLSNLPQAACKSGSKSSENCLKSTHTTSTQTCSSHPPRIHADSQMSVRNSRRRYVCRNKKSKLRLGVADSHYKQTSRQSNRTPLNNKHKDKFSNTLLTPEECLSKLQSSNESFASKKALGESTRSKRTDTKNQKNLNKFQVHKNEKKSSRDNTFHSESSSDAVFNKGKKKKRFKTFLLPSKK